MKQYWINVSILVEAESPYKAGQIIDTLMLENMVVEDYNLEDVEQVDSELDEND